MNSFFRGQLFPSFSCARNNLSQSSSLPLPLRFSHRRSQHCTRLVPMVNGESCQSYSTPGARQHQSVTKQAPDASGMLLRRNCEHGAPCICLLARLPVFGGDCDNFSSRVEFREKRNSLLEAEPVGAKLRPSTGGYVSHWRGCTMTELKLGTKGLHV